MKLVFGVHSSRVEETKQALKEYEAYIQADEDLKNRYRDTKLEFGPVFSDSYDSQPEPKLVLNHLTWEGPRDLFVYRPPMWVFAAALKGMEFAHSQEIAKGGLSVLSKYNGTKEKPSLGMVVFYKTSKTHLRWYEDDEHFARRLGRPLEHSTDQDSLKTIATARRLIGDLNQLTFTVNSRYMESLPKTITPEVAQAAIDLLLRRKELMMVQVTPD